MHAEYVILAAVAGKHEIWAKTALSVQDCDKMIAAWHTWPVWRNNLYNFAQLLFK